MHQHESPAAPQAKVLPQPGQRLSACAASPLVSAGPSAAPEIFRIAFSVAPPLRAVFPRALRGLAALGGAFLATASLQ